MLIKAMVQLNKIDNNRLLIDNRNIILIQSLLVYYKSLPEFALNWKREQEEGNKNMYKSSN